MSAYQNIANQMTNSGRAVGFDLDEMIKLGVLNDGTSGWNGIQLFNYALVDKETFTSSLPTWNSNFTMKPRAKQRFAGTALASKLVLPRNTISSPYEMPGSRSQLIALTAGNIGANTIDFQFGGANDNKGANHPTSGDFTWSVGLPPIGVWESESALKAFEQAFQLLTKAIATGQGIAVDIVEGDLTGLWNTVVDSATSVASLFSDPSNVDNLINLLSDVRKLLPTELVTFSFVISQTEEQMSRSVFTNSFVFKSQKLNIDQNPFPLPPPLATLSELGTAVVAVVRVVLRIVGQIIRLQFGQLIIDMLGKSDEWWAIARYIQNEVIGRLDGTYKADGTKLNAQTDSLFIAGIRVAVLSGTVLFKVTLWVKLEVLGLFAPVR